MEQALLTFLTTGVGVANRIAWGLIPQGTLFPYIVLTKVSGIPEYEMSGDTGVTEYRVQIDFYAKTYKEARNLSATVRGLISGKRFASGFEGAFLLNIRDLHEDDQSPGKQIFRISADYQIFHKE